MIRMRQAGIVLLVLLAMASAIAQPSRLPATKKLIEYGWDVPNPQFVADNIREMEKRPFDGVIFRLAGKYSGNIFSGGKWNVADYQADFTALRRIEWGKFTDNFIMMYSASEMDWFSDEEWAGVLSNVDIMARAAKAGRCQLAFDAEPYGKNPWGYAEQKRAKEKSFEQYQAIARQRGRQFIEVVQRHLPRGALVTLFTYSLFPGEMDQLDPAKRQAALKQHGYGLYHSFLNGMLDGLKSGLTITDGNEPSYYYDNSEKYLAAYHMMRQRALSLIPVANVPKFLLQTQASQALYMDYIFARVPWPNVPAKYMTPEEQAKWFEHNVYWALRTTDEYVWLYSEKMNWWTNTDIPPGMEEAVIRAREAIATGRGLGFDLTERMKAIQERRKAEIDAKLVRRTADIAMLKGAPTPAIDANLSDPAWQGAAKLEPFIGYFGTKPEDLKAKTQALVTYDAINLYIAVQAEEPLVGKMEVVGANHDDAVWNGDSLDVFITKEEDGSPYVHLILSPKNVQWDARFDTDNDMSFDPKWQSATKIGEKEWTAEIAIPWQELGITPQAGLKLRANICRQRRAESEQTCWSQTVSGFMESDHFGTWVLR